MTMEEVFEPAIRHPVISPEADSRTKEKVGLALTIASDVFLPKWAWTDEDSGGAGKFAGLILSTAIVLPNVMNVLFGGSVEPHHMKFAVANYLLANTVAAGLGRAVHYLLPRISVKNYTEANNDK